MPYILENHTWRPQNVSLVSPTTLGGPKMSASQPHLATPKCHYMYNAKPRRAWCSWQLAPPLSSPETRCSCGCSCVRLRPRSALAGARGVGRLPPLPGRRANDETGAWATTRPSGRQGCFLHIPPGRRAASSQVHSVNGINRYIYMYNIGI